MKNQQKRHQNFLMLKVNKKNMDFVTFVWLSVFVYFSKLLLIHHKPDIQESVKPPETFYSPLEVSDVNPINSIAMGGQERQGAFIIKQ